MREEIEHIRTTEVTDEELETAKQTVLNSFVFNFDTKAKTLSRMLNYEYYGYPRDFILQYQKAVAAVTRADVLRVARERLDPESLTIVAVGKPEDFAKPLATFGMPVTSIDLTIPEAKRSRAIRRRQPGPGQETARARAAGRGRRRKARRREGRGGRPPISRWMPRRAA